MTSVALVTGGSSYLASYIIRQLHEQGGVTIRATIRSLKDTKKIEHLKDINVEWHEADLSQPGAFDQVVQGVTVIYHVASPYFYSSTDPQREIVDPAVQGVRSVLEAASKSPSVKQVIVTSSGTAFINIFNPDSNRIYTEKDWNTEATVQSAPYPYSKVVSEKAAWEFMERENPSFGLTVVAPGFIIGPPLNHYSNPSELNTSLKTLLGLITRALKAGAVVSGYSPLYIDVRDVANAHILASQEPEAIGKRLLVGQTSVKWSDAFAEVKRKLENVSKDHPLAKLGEKDLEIQDAPNQPNLKQIKTDLTTTKTVLKGLQFTSIADSLIDTGVWFVDNQFITTE